MVFEPVLRFIVTSDVHTKKDSDCEIEKFKSGMTAAYAYAKSCGYSRTDAFISVGDFAHSGCFEEMQKFKNALDEVIDSETKICLTLASHEFKSGDGEQGAIKRLKEIFSQEPDNSFVVNGYSFICISAQDHNSIEEEKQQWLKKELKKAAARDPKKPIFVFQHPHLSGTVYGSINWGDDDIFSILMDYPQVIDFSGHSHAPINDPRSVHQKYFSCFGTGSFHYFELDEFDKIYGTVPPDAKICGQFLIVEVDKDNRVRVIPVDAISGRFFNDGWLVEKPHDPESFVYTVRERAANALRPYFSPDTECDAVYKDGSLSVSFSQAKQEDDRVNSYTIVVKRAYDNIIICQKNISSSYYLYDMPEKAEIQFDIDMPCGSYILEITANGFWENRSEKFIKKFDI